MRVVAGIVSSIVYVSLEKRFTMRPRGVVSKNDIGEWRTVDSMPLCIFLNKSHLRETHPSTYLDAFIEAYVEQTVAIAITRLPTTPSAA
jgi:hypothetical protein